MMTDTVRCVSLPTEEIGMHPDADPAATLFEPFSLNTLTVANRIIMGPMAVLAPEPDGRPSDQTIAFLSERAKGGVGMIILGGTTGTRRAPGNRR